MAVSIRQFNRLFFDDAKQERKELKKKIITRKHPSEFYYYSIIVITWLDRAMDHTIRHATSPDHSQCTLYNLWLNEPLLAQRA